MSSAYATSAPLIPPEVWQWKVEILWRSDWSFVLQLPKLSADPPSSGLSPSSYGAHWKQIYVRPETDVWEEAERDRRRMMWGSAGWSIKLNVFPSVGGWWKHTSAVGLTHTIITWFFFFVLLLFLEQKTSCGNVLNRSSKEKIHLIKERHL